MSKVLAVNCGSSSLKFQLFEMDTESVITSGIIERIGMEDSIFTIKYNGTKDKKIFAVPTHKEAVQVLLDTLIEKKIVERLDEIKGIGHRVVQGGPYFDSSCVVDDDVIAKIDELSPLAPLHNPAHLQGIKACEVNLPGKPNVAVFDTAFHQTLKKEQYLYPIPYEYYEKYGIRKYGFHGTSHKYVSLEIAKLLGKPIEELKIINCHIGQGVSLCAIQNGVSVDTTMGLTPLGGVAMGSRSGDLDPSVVTYLMSKENMNPAQIDEILNKRSGLLALSGISSDNRDVERAIAQGDERAISSLKEYDFIIAQYIAKMAVTMNGVDVITFTAGVGEKGPISRAGICSHLTFMGVLLDPDKNNSVRDTEKEISSENSRVKVWVVPTNEELMIARETMELVK